MKLNRYQRQILANQYQMIESMTEDARDKKHWAELRDAVESGYEAFYFSDAVALDHHVLTSEETSEVLDILSMYDVLGQSFDKLAPGEAESLRIDADAVKFRGFSGNEEATRMGFVDFFCSRTGGGAFPRLTNDGANTLINSHMPTLDAYRRMLTAWRRLGDARFELTGQQIKAIVGERTHPEHRSKTPH